MKNKLTSRKFWMAVIGFGTMIATHFGVSEEVITDVISLIMAAMCIVAYVVGEGMADGKTEITHVHGLDIMAEVSAETTKQRNCCTSKGGSNHE